jgi:hypothetical protein
VHAVRDEVVGVDLVDTAKRVTGRMDDAVVDDAHRQLERVERGLRLGERKIAAQHVGRLAVDVPR